MYTTHGFSNGSGCGDCSQHYDMKFGVHSINKIAFFHCVCFTQVMQLASRLGGFSRYLYSTVHMINYAGHVFPVDLCHGDLILGYALIHPHRNGFAMQPQSNISQSF